jgi:hypothetical protein
VENRATHPLDQHYVYHQLPFLLIALFMANMEKENIDLSFPQGQMSVLELFFPGLSRISPAIQRYTGIDLNAIVPLLCLSGLLVFIYKRGYQDVSSWVQNNLSQSLPEK